MELFNWKLYSHEELCCNNVKLYDYAIIGTETKIDERSKASGQYCNEMSDQIFLVQYNDYKIAFFSNNSDSVSFNPIEDFYEKNILIDATTLEVPELLLLFKNLSNIQCSIDICYFEPEQYLSSNYEENDCTDTHYVISEDGGGINFIPPFVCPIKKSKIVVSLGFEAHRFGSILESDEYYGDEFYCLFGVPAFKFGMEKISFSMNAKMVSDSKSQVLLSGANDPFQTYEVLEKLKASCNALPTPKGMLLAPFGTKPMAVAMCLFANNYRKKNVGVIYDFVKRSTGRSEGVGAIHIWSLN